MWSRLKSLPWNKILLVSLFVILACSAAGFLYKTFFYKAPAVGIWQPAKPASGMQNQPTHETSPVKLQAYNKDTTVSKMGIPEIVLKDPKLELVATSKTSKDRQGYSTTNAAIADTTTGKVEIIEKKERSLFSFIGATEIGLRGGIGTSGTQGAIYARQDLLRVGNVYAAGYVEINGSATGKADAKAMVDISYRW